jgi:hypothetical protein
VASVRGTNLLDAQAFVRETYGTDSNDRIVPRLGAELGEVFRRPIREDSWYPLEALRAYLVAARQVLDPEAADFFRKQGFFGAQRRKDGALGVMVATPELRMRMAPTAWRMFYDTGHLEVVGTSAREATGRIHGFPTTPELCQRFLGIWEGISSDPGAPARAEELRCVLRGDPFCELRVVYEPEAS